MNKEDGITRITLIIIVVIIVIGVFILLSKDSDFEKTENEVVGTLNTQMESIDDNKVNVVTEKIDISDKFNTSTVVKPGSVQKAEMEVQKSK